MFRILRILVRCKYTEEKETIALRQKLIRYNSLLYFLKIFFFVYCIWSVQRVKVMNHISINYFFLHIPNLTGLRCTSPFFRERHLLTWVEVKECRGSNGPYG